MREALLAAASGDPERQHAALLANLASTEDRWERHCARVLKWDLFYLGMAEYISTASKDPSTKVGAVIVRPNNTLASVGYNGFPRGMSDDDGLYADRETKYSRIVHAEMNAILNAQGPVDKCTLYTSKLPPCDRCAVFVVQAGIKRVVYDAPGDDLWERWGPSLEKTFAIFDEAGIDMTAIHPSQKG